LTRTDEKSVRIIPLGGLGEVGLNMTVFETENGLIVVDCGLMFPEDTMLGVDIVIPNFTYLKERKDKILALVLTHGHEDHIGAVPFFLREFNVPVYGTRLTLALVNNKLVEHGIKKVKTHEIKTDRRVALGDFQLEFVRVAHSIMDGVAVAIDTPQGLILHSGDFKLDFASVGAHTTDIRALTKLGERGVLCLLSDSTNVEQCGFTLSEPEVGQKLSEVFREASGRIIVTLFASNIARIQQVFNIAEQHGRKVCILGRSMVTTINIARRLGYLKISDAQLLDVKKLGRQSKKRTLILTTGSQGEPMSALRRIAMDLHKDIRVTCGDTIILSSKFIPGNEGTIAAMINQLFVKGAQVVYEHIREIHTSGHAHKEELKLMLKLIQPKYFIPIHGEMRHLVQHCRLANNMGVEKQNLLCAKDGDVVAFENEQGSITDSVAHGRVFVDGKGVGDVGNIVLTDRRLLSENGVVSCTIVYDKKTGKILHGPEISSKGFVYEPDFDALFKDISKDAIRVFKQLWENNELENGVGKDKMTRSIRRLLNKTIQRRPLVIPVFIRC
jgi:ribonuclease J